MKKLVLSLLVILGFMFASNAQTFELYHEGELFEMGDKLTVVDYPQVFELIAHMSLKNVSNGPLSILCRKIDIDIVPGSSNTFCWGACYSSSVYLSPLTIVLAPGETTADDIFSGHYYPGGIVGTNKMCYSFFPQNNPTDSTYFYVDYFATPNVGIDNLQADQIFVSNPYPNPANSNVAFDYNFPAGTNSAKINIHNLLGAKVKEVNFSGINGKITINLNDLNDGIYFYSVNINDETFVTKRLVISR